jgi:hypothetical protein
VYVDDTLPFARNQQDIENIIDNLREQGLVLEKESIVAGFIECLEDGSLHLTQISLVNEF